jgi:hypothetical protein
MGRSLVLSLCLQLCLALVGPSPTAAASPNGERLTRAEATTEAREALRETYRKRWTSGRDRRLHCAATSDDAFLCPARWTYRGRAFRRKVLVVDAGGSVSVSIFAR